MAAIGTIKDLFANCRTFEETKLTEKIQLALDSPNAQAAEFASELAVVKGLIGMFVQETKNGTPALPEEHIRQGFGLCSHYESVGKLRAVSSCCIESRKPKVITPFGQQA